MEKIIFRSFQEWRSWKRDSILFWSILTVKCNHGDELQHSLCTKLYYPLYYYKSYRTPKYVFELDFRVFMLQKF